MKPFRPPFSLVTLQVFIAVARLGSFTRAAEAMHLTQSAVSKHVAMLEDHLGVPLLTRAGGVALTEPGQVFLDEVEPAVDQIARAVQRVGRAPPSPASVTFLAPPAVLQFWLVPLLPRFAAEHPHIDLRLSPRLLSSRAARTDLDAEIRFGTGIWQGARSQYLFGREMCVVASPELCRRRGLRDYRDLQGLPLLRHVLYPTAWAEWNATLAPEVALDASGQEYDHYAVMLEAVQAQLGVAIMPRLLVRKYLASGELTAPFDEVMVGSSGYYLVLRETTSPSPAVRTVADWLKARADELAQEWLATARTPVVYADRR